MGCREHAVGFSRGFVRWPFGQTTSAWRFCGLGVVLPRSRTPMLAQQQFRARSAVRNSFSVSPVSTWAPTHAHSVRRTPAWLGGKQCERAGTELMRPFCIERKISVSWQKLSRLCTEPRGSRTKHAPQRGQHEPQHPVQPHPRTFAATGSGAGAGAKEGEAGSASSRRLKQAELAQRAPGHSRGFEAGSMSQAAAQTKKL